MFKSIRLSYTMRIKLKITHFAIHVNKKKMNSRLLAFFKQIPLHLLLCVRLNVFFSNFLIAVV